MQKYKISWDPKIRILKIWYKEGTRREEKPWHTSQLTIWRQGLKIRVDQGDFVAWDQTLSPKAVLWTQATQLWHVLHLGPWPRPPQIAVHKLPWSQSLLYGWPPVQMEPLEHTALPQPIIGRPCSITLSTILALPWILATQAMSLCIVTHVT